MSIFIRQRQKLQIFSIQFENMLMFKVKTKMFISKHVRNVLAFTQAWCRFEAQYSLVDWILRQLRLSSVRQCSLAWDEMSCSAPANSSDVIIKRANFQRVWWPFIFAKKFTADSGNPVLVCREGRRTVLLENQESPAVADKPARRLRKVRTVYVRAVGL